MQTKLILVSVITILSLKLSGQTNFDSLMTKKSLQCPKVADNSSILFSHYILENKIDSAQGILEYWKNKCGINEPVQRAIFMLGLAKDEMLDTLTNDNILAFLYKYKYRMQTIKDLNYTSFYRNEAYYDFVPIGQEFDVVSINFFKEQLQKQRQGSLEHLLSLAYSSNTDTVFLEIDKPEYRTTRLYSKYKERVNIEKNRPQFNLAWLTGAWIPTGNLGKLGVHPEAGFQLGFKKKKMSYDITLCFKFLNSQQAYEAKRTHLNNAAETTSHFFGGYFGIDAGRDIYSKNKNEVQLLSGFGYDGWDALKEDKTKGLRAETVSSYNLNFGLGYRRYLKNFTYIGVRAKYNIVNYTLNNIVDFTGNPVSITFVIGGLTPRGF